MKQPADDGVRVGELRETSQTAVDQVDLPRLEGDEDRLGVPLVTVLIGRIRVGEGDLPATSERTLTQRELNRSLLARQLLLERARLPIPRALERIGGIQNQYAPNAYIRLWSCLEEFRCDDLTRALERPDP